MRKHNLFNKELITLGVSTILHSYYALIQDLIQVDTFITALWGIVNLGLVYGLIVSFAPVKNKKNI